MTRSVGSDPYIPTFVSHETLRPNERSISSGETRVSADGNFVTITEGSDGNDKFRNQTFPIVRYEFGGARIVFKV